MDNRQIDQLKNELDNYLNDDREQGTGAGEDLIIDNKQERLNNRGGMRDQGGGITGNLKVIITPSPSQKKSVPKISEGVSKKNEDSENSGGVSEKISGLNFLIPKGLDLEKEGLVKSSGKPVDKEPKARFWSDEWNGWRLKERYKIFKDGYPEGVDGDRMYKLTGNEIMGRVGGTGEGIYSIDLIQREFQIVNKSREKVPFVLNPLQLAFMSEMSAFNVIVKAKKQGFSSVILAFYLAECILKEYCYAISVSHEKESTKRLLDRVNRYYWSLDKSIRPVLDKDNVSEMSFVDTHSRFYVGAAGQRAFSRGDDVSHAHLSELDWWAKTEALTGIMEALIENAIATIESTAHGFGSILHNIYNSARDRISDWRDFFFAWYDSPEYELEFQGNTHHMKEEFVGFKGIFGCEEKEYIDRHHLSQRKVNWMRGKLRSMTDPTKFPQEYPGDDLECFLSSGSKRFNVIQLKKQLGLKKEPIVRGDLSWKEVKDSAGKVIKKEIIFDENPDGCLWVYEYPYKEGQYAIGADVAEGIEIESKGLLDENEPTKAAGAGDFSAAIVMNKKTFEVAAKYHTHIEPSMYGETLDLLGRYYNECLMAVERNNHGISTLSVLERECDYPNLFYQVTRDELVEEVKKKFGWVTDKDGKNLIINTLARALLKDTIRIYDERTIKECLSYIKTPAGKCKGERGATDDCVIALAICLKMCYDDPYDAPVDPDLQIKLRHREANNLYGNYQIEDAGITDDKNNFDIDR